MLEKAAGADVDEVVIDLEDAVSPARKKDALAAAVAALARGFTAGKVSVRVNPPGTQWAHTELITLAMAAVRPDSVVVPKLQSAADVEFVEQLLEDGEAAVAAPLGGHRIGVQGLIETASGLAKLGDITATSRRLEALIIGYADLAVSLGRTAEGAANLDLWLAVQDAVLVAARAADLRAIDGPFLDFQDSDGLERSARRAAELGFDGKWAIHPAQAEGIRTAFAPSPEAVARAQAVLDALASAAESDLGAVGLDGVMLDEPVRLAALRTLARAGLPSAEAA